MKNQGNKPVENGNKNIEHTGPGGQDSARATGSVRQTVKEELKPQNCGASKEKKRKCSESKQSNSSSPSKIPKVQNEAQQGNNQNSPSKEEKCPVKTNGEEKKQDTEQKNKESVKDESNAKDFSHKVLDENKKETEEEIIKPEEEYDGQVKTMAEFTEYLQRRASLPFPAASGHFYAKQYDKTTKNIQRRERRTENPALFVKNDMIGLQGRNVEGNLEENKQSIENKIKQCKDQSKHTQLLGVAEVAKEL